MVMMTMMKEGRIIHIVPYQNNSESVDQNILIGFYQNIGLDASSRPAIALHPLFYNPGHHTTECYIYSETKYRVFGASVLSPAPFHGSLAKLVINSPSPEY